MRWRGWILGGLLVALLVAYVGGFFLLTEFRTSGPRDPFNVRFFPSEGAMRFWAPMRNWDYTVHGRMPWVAPTAPPE